MSDKIQTHSQIDLFLQGNRNIKTPFTIRHGDTDYICTNVLRLLPSKRLVLDVKTADQHLLIKLFSPRQKGQRELAREQRGYVLATASGFNVPELLLTSDNMAGCYAIGYQFVENTQTFKLDDDAKSVECIVKLFNFIAKMHLYGIYQDDIHLDNILTLNGELYLIDLSSIVCEQQGVPLSKASSVKNLAKLIAQFTPLVQTKLIDQLSVYYQERDWIFDKQQQAQLVSSLEKAWQKRKRNYLSKCFRECTMTHYGHSFTREFAFKSDFINRISIDLINDIDLLMTKGNVLKSGDSATVVQIEIDGVKLVIKRYNIKSFGHFLRRCLRPSRAAVSWRNANLLEFIGLPTPRPLGFIEKRVGWFRKTAYFISEYTQSEELLTVYQRRQPTEDELDQINTIFVLMEKDQISHGDLKASNLLLDETGKVSMIDLDAMQQHSTYKSFQHDFKKDKQRFIRNWQDVKIKVIFTSLVLLENNE